MVQHVIGSANVPADRLVMGIQPVCRPGLCLSVSSPGSMSLGRKIRGMKLPPCILEAIPEIHHFLHLPGG